MLEIFEDAKRIEKLIEKMEALNLGMDYCNLDYTLVHKFQHQNYYDYYNYELTWQQRQIKLDYYNWNIKQQRL